MAKCLVVVLAVTVMAGCAPEIVPDAVGKSERVTGVKMRDGDGRCIWLQLTAGKYQSLYATPLDDQACAR